MKRIFSNMGRFSFLFLCLFILFTFARPAAADFKLTETLSLKWHADNMDGVDKNDDYFDIKNRINVLFIEQWIETSLRLDTMTILDYDAETPEAPVGREYTDDYRVERIGAVLKPVQGLKVNLGDFYAQLGKGILLSLRKVDEFGMETALRGAKVDYTYKIVSFSVLGGVTNINNIDEQDNYFNEDPMDRVVGTRVSIRPHRRVKLQVHGLLLNWQEEKFQETFSPMAYGTGLMLEANLWPGKLTAEAEFDVLWRQKVTLDDATGTPGLNEYQRGEAAYLNVHGTFGPVSLLLEGKWYEDFLITGSKVGDTTITYNQAPTTERSDQEVHADWNVYGGRFKADWRIFENLSIYANLSGGDYAPLTHVADGDDSKRLAYYLHTYAGLQMFWNSGLSELSVSGGYRREMEPKKSFVPEEDVEGWDKKVELYHVEAKLLYYVSSGWSIYYSLLHESWGRKLAVDFVNYSRGTQIIGVNLSGVMSLAAAFEYDTELLKSPFKRNLYGWLQAKFYPAESLVLVMKGGLERGGLKCVSGVCKNVPPFAGFKLDVIYRY
ncbi:MAG: hypothetical protein ABIJ56_15145 [Pseudomonadota bacterium]